jgi:hypothetical protein
MHPSPVALRYVYQKTGHMHKNRVYVFSHANAQKLILRERSSDQKTNNHASIAGLWKLYTCQEGTRNRKVKIEVKTPIFILRASPVHKRHIGDVGQT